MWISGINYRYGKVVGPQSEYLHHRWLQKGLKCSVYIPYHFHRRQEWGKIKGDAKDTSRCGWSAWDKEKVGPFIWLHCNNNKLRKQWGWPLLWIQQHRAPGSPTFNRAPHLPGMIYNTDVFLYGGWAFEPPQAPGPHCNCYLCISYGYAPAVLAYSSILTLQQSKKPV